jgi:hypothetical protein
MPVSRAALKLSQALFYKAAVIPSLKLSSGK